MMSGYLKHRQNLEKSCVLGKAVMTAADCTVQRVPVALTAVRRTEISYGKLRFSGKTE